MDLPIYQVDAFTDRPFSGNPAGVCPLDAWLPDATLQAIAAEMNLAETAFFVPRGDAFEIRWFTPTVEVDLCGHATLASAAVLFERLQPERAAVTFDSRSGPLGVTRDGALLELDFPSRPARAVPLDAELVAALGARPRATLLARDLLAVFDSAEEVRALTPDFARLTPVTPFAVCATAPGTGADADVDFVSRFFAPAAGIPEDPVTGSSHSTLTPYWAARLGKQQLRARQVSQRGGELRVTQRGERVGIAGQAVLVLEGTLRV